MVAELGEVVWIVDLNRQSLDRVVPNIARRTRLQGMFAAAGWQVLTVKYGRLLEELFTRPGGDALRAPHRRRCPTPSTSGCCAARRPAARPAARRRCPARSIAELDRRRLDDDTLLAAIRNLGGHDLGALTDAFDADRRHPADRDLRLHRQGPRAGRPRDTRRTTRRC